MSDMKLYVASDGSIWHQYPGDFVSFATHEDYDGAVDSGDNRLVHSPRSQALPDLIERFIEETE